MAVQAKVVDFGTKTAPRLLLITNKSQTRFQLVPKSTTLVDPERPLCALLHYTCLSEPITIF